MPSLMKPVHLILGQTHQTCRKHTPPIPTNPKMAMFVSINRAIEMVKKYPTHSRQANVQGKYPHTIMIQWKIGAPPNCSCTFQNNFPLNHDDGRRSKLVGKWCLNRYYFDLWVNFLVPEINQRKTDRLFGTRCFWVPESRSTSRSCYGGRTSWGWKMDFLHQRSTRNTDQFFFGGGWQWPTRRTKHWFSKGSWCWNPRSLGSRSRW